MRLPWVGSAVPRVPDISLARSSGRKQTLGKPGRGGSTVAVTGGRSPHGDKWDVRSASLPSDIGGDSVPRIRTTRNGYQATGPDSSEVRMGDIAVLVEIATEGDGYQ